MKKLNYLLLVIAIAVSINTSCKKDKKKDETPAVVFSNTFSYSGKDYAISKGLLMKYSKVNSLYEMCVMMYSGYSMVTSGNNIVNIFGIGNHAKFQVYANDTTTLSPGTFTYNTNGNAGTFKIAEVAMDYALGKKTDDLYKITAGTVNIKKNGSDYEITFDCTDEKNVNVKGSFKAPLAVFNRYDF